MKLDEYEPTSPKMLEEIRLDLVRKESSFMSKESKDKNKNSDMNKKKILWAYNNKLDNFSFKINGIKLLFIFIEYKHQNEK